MLRVSVPGRVVALMTVIVLTAGASAAQSIGATTGSLNGRVTDAIGGVMPGVTVTRGSTGSPGLFSYYTHNIIAVISLEAS
jgi:hypothetical protein